MEPHILVAPNLNGKVYREFLPRQNTINTFLDFIDINNDHVLLGTSNLNGRHWDGSLCFYKNFTTNSNFEVQNTQHIEFLDSGVTDGKILPNNKKVLIAQDSGEVRLFDIEDSGLKSIKQNCGEHDDYITEISVWSDTRSFITGSADACIKVWDITDCENIKNIQSYNYIHSNLVSSVSANIADNNLFVSCSYDKTAVLWDKREEHPGNIIYENEFCALTKIEWHPTKPYVVAVSTSAGDIYLVDVREPKEFVTKKSCFERSIHRTKFNSKGLLAVCADESKVIVLDCTEDEMKVVYEDDRHEDFVRGLAWTEDVLVTCGWDKQVLFHNFLN